MYVIAARGSPVAFTAVRTSNIYNSIVKIVFDKVITNVGGAYSNTTGTFTCPTDGVYVFIWTLMTMDGKMCAANLYVNGNRRSLQARANIQSVSSHSTVQGTMSGTFRLSAGDRVWVQTTSCNYFYGNPYNAFSGWKL